MDAQWFVGIDYSMTCPAACAWMPGQVYFWFANVKQYPPLDDVAQTVVPEGLTGVARSRVLAQGFLRWVMMFRNPIVGIEDYAFAATGRVFHIGENTGVLKYLLYEQGVPLECVPPTVIKKFGTGKGNADKYKMTGAFLKEFDASRAWIPKLFPRTKDDLPAKSPLADMADAYWLARYLAK